VFILILLSNALKLVGRQAEHRQVKSIAYNYSQKIVLENLT